MLLVLDYGTRFVDVATKGIRRIGYPEVSVTRDGRVIVGDADDLRWWIADDADDRSFTKLKTPAKLSHVRELGGRLFGWGRWDNPDSGVWTSRDSGRTWKRFTL